MKNQVAVIVGGASAMRQVIAQRLAQEEFAIAIADTSYPEGIEELVLAEKVRFYYQPCDVTSEVEVQAFAATVSERLGTVSVLVNCMDLPSFTSFSKLSFTAWREVLAYHLDALFLGSKAFLPMMQADGFGRIINLTTAALTFPLQKAVPYLTAKMGVIGFTRALAAELSDTGVTVNAIAPNLSSTPVSRERANQMLLDVALPPLNIDGMNVMEATAETVAFLTSEHAREISGQTFLVEAI